MTKSLILLVLGLGLIIWILIGYSKKRRLETSLANYFCVGIRKSIIFCIDGDKLPWIFRVIPIPPGFRHIWPKLKWWEWVDGKNKMNEKIINHETGKEEPKYKEIKTFPTAPDGFMGLREEFVPSIRKYEPTGYNIEVRTYEGYLVNIILPLVYFVFDPYKVVRFALFKMVGELEVNNAIRPWAATKPAVDIQKININQVSAISVPSPEPGNPLIDLETYLDEYHFKKLGFEIDKKGLFIIPSVELKKLFDSMNKKSLIQQEGENAKEEAKTREIQRDVELADQKQKSLILQERIAATATGFGPMLDQIYKGKALVAAQQPFTLVSVRHEEDEIGETYIKGMMAKFPGVEASVFKKQKEKEETNEEETES